MLWWSLPTIPALFNDAHAGPRCGSAPPLIPVWVFEMCQPDVQGLHLLEAPSLTSSLWMGKTHTHARVAIPISRCPCVRQKCTFVEKKTNKQKNKKHANYLHMDLNRDSDKMLKLKLFIYHLTQVKLRQVVQQLVMQWSTQFIPLLPPPTLLFLAIMFLKFWDWGLPVLLVVEKIECMKRHQIVFHSHTMSESI